MRILESSLEKSFRKKSRKVFRKAITLSLERKLRNNNEVFTNYVLLALSLHVICNVIYYLHGIAVKMGISK